MAKKNEIFLFDADSPSLSVLFDTATGLAKPESAPHRKAQGNLKRMAGGICALYAEQGALYLQIDKKRWNLSDPSVAVSYGHDLASKTTVFAVGGTKLEYPAWWRDAPDFEPTLPERDADEDYLGYIYAVARQPELKAALLKSWAAPQPKNGM
jgi:hypothetical protein